MIRRMSVLLVPLLACMAIAGQAQDYPAKPILIIAPFAPGTAVDFVARLAARSMAEQFKVAVTVENRLSARSFPTHATASSMKLLKRMSLSVVIAARLAAIPRLS